MAYRMFVAPTTSRHTSKVSPSKKGSTQSSGFRTMIDDGGNTTQSMDTSQNIGSVDGLLTLQSIDGTMSDQELAVSKGFRLLDELDALKISLLGGQLPGRELKALQDNINSLPETNLPKNLQSTLDEIKLRARVELAKRGIS